MPRVEVAELLAAGCHFGHLTRRWNPKMKPYIFMERNGIHIVDLMKTRDLLEEAENVARKNGFSRMAVISAIGTRHYYLDRGFERGEYYLVKKI